MRVLPAVGGSPVALIQGMSPAARVLRPDCEADAGFRRGRLLSNPEASPWGSAGLSREALPSARLRLTNGKKRDRQLGGRSLISKTFPSGSRK
jgi:hypothetical protein